MSATFAGSKSLDERRRRRLASTSDEPSTSADVLSGSVRRGRVAARDACERRERSGSRFPLRKLISRRAWKLAAFGLLILLAGAGVVAGGWEATVHAERLGPGFVRLFSLTPGRAFHGFSTFLLLATAQLSLIIWWVRSRNPRDFGGQYRAWFSAAVVLFGFAAVALTEAHLALGDTVGWLWPGRIWRQEALCWMLPLALCGVVLLRTLEAEMRRCRSGWVMLWLAVPAWLAAAALVLDLPIAARVPHQNLALAGALMFAHWSLFMSLLLQARYVIHETADPPLAQPSWLHRALTTVAAHIRLPRLKLPSLRRARPAAETEPAVTTKAKKPAASRRKSETIVEQTVDGEPPSKSKSPSRASTTRKASRSTPQPAPSEPEAADDPGSLESEQAATVPMTSTPRQSKPRVPSSGHSEAADPPPRVAPVGGDSESDAEQNDAAASVWTDGDASGSDQLSGLSKRERKKLLKQQRQQQRTQRRAA